MITCLRSCIVEEISIPVICFNCIMRVWQRLQGADKSSLTEVTELVYAFEWFCLDRAVEIKEFWNEESTSDDRIRIRIWLETLGILDKWLWISVSLDKWLWISVAIHVTNLLLINNVLRMIKLLWLWIMLVWSILGKFRVLNFVNMLEIPDQQFSG